MKIKVFFLSAAVTAFVANESFAHIQVAKRFSAEQVIRHQNDLRTQVNNGLENPEVMQELQKLGVSPLEVKERLLAMSDSELNQIYQGVDRQAGGDVLVIGLGTLIIIALLVFILVKLT